MCEKWYDGRCQPVRQEFMKNECEALPGVAYPGVRHNRSTVNTKTGYDDDDVMWHDHDIDFARWLHPAMWHVALESWQWIHQVAAPCNAIRGCGMTCHWIRPNVRHIGILHLVSIFTHHHSRHVIQYQSAKFYPNRTNSAEEKWRHFDFQDGGSQQSWIVGIQ